MNLAQKRNRGKNKSIHNKALEIERVPQNTFLNSIILRHAHRLRGMLLSCSGTRQTS